MHEPGGSEPQHLPAPELELELEQAFISEEVHEPGGSEPQHLLLDPPPKPPCEKLLDPDPQDFISEEVHEPGGSEPQHLPAPELEPELKQAYI